MDLSSFIEGETKSIHIEGDLEPIYDAIIDAVVEICKTKSNRTIFIYGHHPSMLNKIAEDFMGEPPGMGALDTFTTHSDVTIAMRPPNSDLCGGDNPDSMIFLDYMVADVKFLNHFIEPSFMVKRPMIIIKRGVELNPLCDAKPLCNVTIVHEL
jgi:hypothetical protein